MPTAGSLTNGATAIVAGGWLTMAIVPSTAMRPTPVGGVGDERSPFVADRAAGGIDAGAVVVPLTLTLTLT